MPLAIIFNFSLSKNLRRDPGTDQREERACTHFLLPQCFSTGRAQWPKKSRRDDCCWHCAHQANCAAEEILTCSECVCDRHGDVR